MTVCEPCSVARHGLIQLGANGCVHHEHPVVATVDEVRQTIEQVWERQGLLFLTMGETQALRELLRRQDAVVTKAVDISQGRMPDQHRLDLQRIVVEHGFLSQELAKGAQ